MRALWLFLIAAAFATPVGAYEIAPGDVVVRVLTGPSVNAARLTAATRATPPAGLLLGAGLELAITERLGLTVDLAETVASGFSDTRLAAGIRARVKTVDATLHPYGSLALTTAVGVPLGHGEAHWNLGVRGAVGFEYFLTRRVALGLELGAEPALLLFPLQAVELSVEALVSAAFRF